MTRSRETLLTFSVSYEVPEARRFCFACRLGADTKPSNRELMTITATKGVEKGLHLHFSTNSKDSRSFHLKLEPPLATSNLADLRRLHLRSVIQYPLASSFVSALSSSCHLLESLDLEECPGLETIVIDKNSSLQELAISDCPDLDCVSICAMELKSFRYRGALLKIQLKCTLSSAEVALDIRDGPQARKSFHSWTR